MAAAAAIFINAEINRAVGGLISDTPGDQLFNEADDLRDVFGGARLFVRFETAEGFQILQKGGFKLAGELAQGGLIFAHPLDDLVLHVRDVHHVFHLVAGEFERATDQIGKDERAPVADVGEVIDRRSAAVHAHAFAGGVQWGERLHRA